MQSNLHYFWTPDINDTLDGGEVGHVLVYGFQDDYVDAHGCT
ncbi:hypothetical protein [Pseudomonas helleri]|nr:hypothetical protein [Pseudomonas helleri]